MSSLQRFLKPFLDLANIVGVKIDDPKDVPSSTIQKLVFQKAAKAIAEKDVEIEQHETMYAAILKHNRFLMDFIHESEHEKIADHWANECNWGWPIQKGNSMAEKDRLREIVFKDAPDWANWAAMNKSGNWAVYREKPTIDESKGTWLAKKTLLRWVTWSKIDHAPETNLHWTDSLISR